MCEYLWIFRRFLENPRVALLLLGPNLGLCLLSILSSHKGGHVGSVTPPQFCSTVDVAEPEAQALFRLMRAGAFPQNKRTNISLIWLLFCLKSLTFAPSLAIISLSTVRVRSIRRSRPSCFFLTLNCFLATLRFWLILLIILVDK